MAARRLQQLRPILQRCILQPFSTHQFHPDVIQVTPKVSRFDQKVHIKVRGLPSQAKVTLHASTLHEWQRKPVQFVSYGHYVSSQTGEVDLEEDVSLGGSYTGVEPMGLFWSMIPSPSCSLNIRMVVKNVELPVVYTVSIYLGHLTLDELCQGNSQHQLFSTLDVERIVKPADVRRIPVKEGSARGTLFLPPGEGPFPGVIDMFGMAGGLMEIRAAMLAAHGFATYALPFFRYDDLPETFEDQTFDYFKNAAEWFSSHPSVCPGGVGIVAISGGAAIGITMAWKCPQIKAFVNINGPCFGGMFNMLYLGTEMKQEMLLDTSLCRVTDEGMVMKNAWKFTDADLIPLWESDVHMLALVSDDDGQVNPSVNDILYKLYPEDRRHLMEVVHYPGAGHLLEPPYNPHCRFCLNPYFGRDMLWGGHVKEHAEAQEDSWQRIIHFFSKHLPSST